MAGLPSDSSSTGSDFPYIIELTISSPDDDVRGKPSARTVALTTEDILREIFWRFDIASDSNHAAANRTALLYAALACMAFMEPALDVLWWSMSSMMPALKLLPNLQIVPNTSNTFTFSNGFSDDGWARFDYHSKRVREFHYHSAPAQEMATAALFHFSQYRPTIFPRLRKIVWTTRLSPSIMLLTPPTLNSLDIAGIEGDNPSIMTTLLLVLGHSPQPVTEIALRGPISGTYLTLVPKMTSLSTIIIPDFDVSVYMTFLRQLGTLDGLENLHINLQTSATESFALPANIGFPALRTLRVSGRFDLIYRFTVAIMSEQVISVSVSSKCSGKLPQPPQPPPSPKSIMAKKKKKLVPHSPPKHVYDSQQPSDFSDLLAFITARWPHLSRLDFDLPNMSPKYPDTTSYTLLEPIHNCPLAESISIRGFSRILSSDQDLVDIGSSLPNARVLMIPFSLSPAVNPTEVTSTFHPQGTPTILGLGLLAELCPRLTSLQLSIDTRDMPLFAGVPLTHGLQTLSVGDSPVGDAFLVAKHLDCLFPYLKKISGSNPVSVTSYNEWNGMTTIKSIDSVRDGWELVEKVLHNCQAARADEHKRTEMRNTSRKFNTNVGCTGAITS